MSARVSSQSTVLVLFRNDGDKDEDVVRVLRGFDIFGVAAILTL